MSTHLKHRRDDGDRREVILDSPDAAALATVADYLISKTAYAADHCLSILRQARSFASQAPHILGPAARDVRRILQ